MAKFDRKGSVHIFVFVLIIVVLSIAIIGWRVITSRHKKGFPKPTVTHTVKQSTHPSPVQQPVSSGVVPMINFATMPNGSLPATWGYDLGDGGPDNPGWGNNETEYYTDNSANVRIESGHLVIEAIKQDKNGSHYTSARVTTFPFFSFTYGKLDVVAKLPSGVGTWPAIWLLPSHPKYGDPQSTDPNNWLKDGELDIMESVGSDPDKVTSSAHSYAYNPTNDNERTAEQAVAGSARGFHDYGIDWTPNKITFAVDGQVYHTIDKQPGDTSLQWPYDQPYYLILNLAMGGDNGGTLKAQYPPNGINDKSGPWQFLVNSVNYTPYKP